MTNYNQNDKQKALDLANKLQFENINITDNHMETSFVLFIDENNGTWSIDGTYYGKYKLSYENERICGIDKALENELDIFIEEYKNSDEVEKHQEEQFRDFQNELWQNTNRNHF